MRKVLTFLGASLCLAWVVPAGAQAPDMFRDVDRSHWAYEAVESLRAKNILIGYPDGYFRGKRTLTRYEFAVALDRALRSITGTPGERGPQGETGPAGPAGPQGEQGSPGIKPEEIAQLQRLANEFREELARLGNNVQAINRRLEQLAKDVDDIKTRLDKMPRISGGVFVGIRGDEADGGYVDKDGRLRGVSQGPSGEQRILGDPAVVHQFVLGVDATLSGGTEVGARLVTGNYKNYLGSFGNNLSGPPGGPYNNLLNPAPQSDTYLDRLEINAPLSTFGRDSRLTIGRFHHQVSPLTLWKPDVDTYFDNPFVDDGMFRMDGFKLDTNFGSFNFQAFGAKMASVQGTDGNPFNSPLAGVGNGTVVGETYGTMGTNLFGGGNKPIGQPYQGQMVVDQVAGVTLGLGHRLLDGGNVRFSAIDTSNKGYTTRGLGFNNVLILGADFDVKFWDRWNFKGAWGKTITGTGIDSPVNTHMNNAFTGSFGYRSGPVDVSAGYKYVDPLFYAPGYWGRIGNWINPTNVQGPTLRASYDVTPKIGLSVGGDWYTTARRMDPIGLGAADDIYRVLVGVRWDIASNFRTTVDWEGVFWALDNARFDEGGGKVHPTEHYITIGAGYNVTDSTLLKLGYQIGDFNGKGALNSGAGTRMNYNTLTGTVAVKF